jgi:hypothetical protein
MVRVSKDNQCKIWHKKAIFGAKSSEIGHTKIALDFCFMSSKDQLKMCKISVLSSHALPEK